MKKKIMTPEQFAERMRAIEKDEGADIEQSHCHADNLMCDLLESLGYEEGVKIFTNMDKWYA